MKPYFFGCARIKPTDPAGHYLYGPQLTRTTTRAAEVSRQLGGEIDQGFAPFQEHEQGDAFLTHIAGWTVLAWWDYSGDSRPGSNSAVVVEGTHDLATVARLFETEFPTMFARQPRPLRVFRNKEYHRCAGPREPVTLQVR